MTHRRHEAAIGSAGIDTERQRVQVERIGLDNVTDELLDELKDPLDRAYPNGHMHEDLVEDVRRRPEIFQMFLAKTSQRIVGLRVVESKVLEEIDYLGFPPVNGKRFTVHPEFRGQGIGKRILDAGHEYCFGELNLRAVFGASGEAGALAMYGREGAMYNLATIQGRTHKWSEENHFNFFREFITNPVFREYRFPDKPDISFVYPRDEETAEFFRQHGYVSMPELIGESG